MKKISNSKGDVFCSGPKKKTRVEKTLFDTKMPVHPGKDHLEDTGNEGCPNVVNLLSTQAGRKSRKARSTKNSIHKTHREVH